MNNNKKFNKDLNVIGSKIRYYREQKNLSQAQLSAKLELLGISIPKNSIQRLECNNRIIKDFELAGITKVYKLWREFFSSDYSSFFQF